MQLIAMPVLLAAMFASSAATASVPLLPGVGASVTFTATSHTDLPNRPGGFQGGPPDGGGFPGGGGPSGGGSPEGGPPSGGPGDFMRDQQGTITLLRDDSGIEPLVNGDLDDITGPLNISSRGVVDAGTPPNRFVVAFDNAIALAEGMPSKVASNESFGANLELIAGGGAFASIPMTMKIASVSGDDIKMLGTGKGTIPAMAQGGDQSSAAVDVTVSAEIKGGRLMAYSQKVAQTMSMHDNSFTITTTIGLAAATAPADSSL